MTHPNAIPTSDLRIPVSPSQIRSDFLMSMAYAYGEAGLLRDAGDFYLAAVDAARRVSDRRVVVHLGNGRMM